MEGEENPRREDLGAALVADAALGVEQGHEPGDDLEVHQDIDALLLVGKEALEELLGRKISWSETNSAKGSSIKTM